MKRLMLVCLLIPLCLVPLGAWAESPADQPLVCGNFQYILLEDGSAEITNYTGKESNVVVPADLDGHPVSAIGDHALQGGPGRTGITGVTLPDSIRRIGDSAFRASGLSSVDLPEGLETIGTMAFNCCNFTTVDLPESLISIGEGAFAGTGLTEITLPGNLVELGGPNCFGPVLKSIAVSPDNPYWHVIDGFLYRKEDACLFLCPGGLELAACEIPAGTAVIGNGAFGGNFSLTSVVVPDGVTVIGESAFGGCPKLSEITLPGSLREIGSGAFRNCALTSLTLPEGLSVLGDYACSGCDKLTSVSLPVTLTDVGANPFCECEKLNEIMVPEDHPALRFEHGLLFDRNKGVLICFAPGFPETDCTIPDGITVIGACAFYMTEVESVTIPDSVAEIGEMAFTECHYLEYIALPESMRRLEAGCFQLCPLSDIDLPEGLISIGEGAFEGCDEMRNVHISSTVREIDGNPFLYCNELVRITVSPESPYYEVINGTLIEKADKRLVCFPEGLRDEHIEIPNGVLVIGQNACSMMDTPCEIIVPEGVTVLEDGSFSYCTDVYIHLPASVTVISPSAFYCQGGRGPILHVVPGSVAEAFGNEKGFRCILQKSDEDSGRTP